MSEEVEALVAPVWQEHRLQGYPIIIVGKAELKTRYGESCYSNTPKQSKTEAQTRKDLPLYTGVLKYFPDALLAVAEVSRIGNDQHNPGQPLHWAKGKSTDHLDSMLRHAVDAGTLDTDGGRHSAKIAWRALANLQTEIENEKALQK